MAKKLKVCSICNKAYIGYGNNAEPISSGRCCDKCNDIVIAARLVNLRLKAGLK